MNKFENYRTAAAGMNFIYLYIYLSIYYNLWHTNKGSQWMNARMQDECKSRRAHTRQILPSYGSDINPLSPNIKI